MKAALYFVLLLAIATPAFADLTTPVIKRVAFDPSGRLSVVVTSQPPQGCYLSVYGGLTRNKVDTGIISTLLDSDDANAKQVKILTKRRYYCKRRKLFVSVEAVCLKDDLIGSATSSVMAVAVPEANIR